MLSGHFKKYAEELAEEVRKELGVSNLVALDPFELLEWLEIPHLSLGQLVALGGNSELATAADFLRAEDSSSLSAMTVFYGKRRLLIYNESHAECRRNSDLCHEAGHALLLHEPAVSIDGRGCRSWNGEIEDEAQYLAGALLIPAKGARYSAKAGWSLQVVAQRYSSSVEMARWRDNVSGGRRIRGRS